MMFSLLSLLLHLKGCHVCVGVFGALTLHRSPLISVSQIYPDIHPYSHLFIHPPINIYYHNYFITMAKKKKGGGISL